MRVRAYCCISYYSYIKPQPNYESARIKSVVYRTIPTSNHNTCILCVCARIVVYRTIPTSNHNSTIDVRINFMLYIVLFLHQTTTQNVEFYFVPCCISYYSYIKPQPPLQTAAFTRVVYRTIPTSNHNLACSNLDLLHVVYRTIPTSNHNRLKA